MLRPAAQPSCGAASVKLQADAPSHREDPAHH